MTKEETLKRIEEEAEKVATNLGWDEDGTAERYDIIRAYKDGAKSERNKTLDEAIDELLDTLTASDQQPKKFTYAECKKILESLKVDL